MCGSIPLITDVFMARHVSNNRDNFIVTFNFEISPIHRLFSLSVHILPYKSQYTEWVQMHYLLTVVSEVIVMNRESRAECWNCNPTTEAAASIPPSRGKMA